METMLATAFGQAIEIQKGQSNQLTEAASVISGAVQEHKMFSKPFMIMLLSKCWRVSL